MQTHSHEFYLATLQALVCAGVSTYEHGGKGLDYTDRSYSSRQNGPQVARGNSLIPEGIRKCQSYTFCFRTGFFSDSYYFCSLLPSVFSLSSKRHCFLIKCEGRFAEKRENLCSSCPKLISILVALLFAYLKRSHYLTEGRIAFAF